MAVYIREAGFDDLKRIIEIVEKAREKLVERGIPQWQNGDGPSEKVIREDIFRGECYVLIADTQIVGVGTLTRLPEAAYEMIENGRWEGQEDHYIAIHRVAIDADQHGKGYAKQLLQYLIVAARLKGHRDIRIDTHPNNIMMQRTVEAAGFKKIGDVILAVSNGERLAYQLCLT